MDRKWACKACGCPIHCRGDFLRVVFEGEEQTYHTDCVEEEGVCEACGCAGELLVKEFMERPEAVALLCLNCKRQIADLRVAYAFLTKHGQLNKK